MVSRTASWIYMNHNVLDIRKLLLNIFVDTFSYFMSILRD